MSSCHEQTRESFPISHTRNDVMVNNRANSCIVPTPTDYLCVIFEPFIIIVFPSPFCLSSMRPRNDIPEKVCYDKPSHRHYHYARGFSRVLPRGIIIVIIIDSSVIICQAGQQSLWRSERTEAHSKQRISPQRRSVAQ